MGYKLFKRTLVPEIPFEQDQVAQALLDREEDVDLSKPPAELEGKSIREPLVTFPYREKVVSKKEALSGTTVVSERRKNGKKKASKSKKDSKTEEEAPEQPSVAGDEGLIRVKGESKEERKARKELVKQLKEERKDKKQKFKEKYEQVKKGLVAQHNAQLEGGVGKGVAVYRFD